MNKFFTITLCSLSLLLNQATLPQITEVNTYRKEIHLHPEEINTYSRTDTLTLHKEFLKEPILRITPEKTIVVNSCSDSDTLLIVFYQGKLKIYHAYIPLQTLQEIQEEFNAMYACEDIPLYSNSNDPIFDTPNVKLQEAYYSNSEQCFINTEKSIDLRESIIESPHIVLKTKEIELGSFLINTHTVELQSNNQKSLLSSIKFTLKEGTNFEFQPLLMGTVAFESNFAAVSCSYASKVEIQCLPGSFYLEDNAICFNQILSTNFIYSAQTKVNISTQEELQDLQTPETSSCFLEEEEEEDNEDDENQMDLYLQRLEDQYLFLNNQKSSFNGWKIFKGFAGLYIGANSLIYGGAGIAMTLACPPDLLPDDLELSPSGQLLTNRYFWLSLSGTLTVFSLWVLKRSLNNLYEGLNGAEDKA